MYEILIVEDDATIAALLAEHLRSWGFGAHCAEDFSDVMGEFERAHPHLVLLDISLPFYNGLYWCGMIRRVSNVPVIFLTSHTDSADIITAVSQGGDDYITKPFSVDVVLAKINALLRRTYSYAGDPQTVQAGGLLLNTGDATAVFGGATAQLTKNELRILDTLMRAKNTVVPRERIMQRLWEGDDFVDDNTLTVNINRLRRTLEGIGCADFIVTRKGEGYIVHD